VPYRKKTRRLEEVAGGPKTRWTWWTAGIRLSFFLPSFEFLLLFLAELFLRKEKIKEREGFGKISKQVQTTSSKQDFAPKQFLKGLQILKF
jgi:hypothetical protein